MQRSLLKSSSTVEPRKSRRGSQFSSRPSSNDLASINEDHSHHGLVSSDGDVQLNDAKYKIIDIRLDLRCDDAPTTDVTPASESPLNTPGVSKQPSFSSLADYQLSTDFDLIPLSQSPFVSPNVSRRPSLSLECTDTTTTTSETTPCTTPLSAPTKGSIRVIPIEHRIVKFKYQWGEYEGQMQGDVMQGKGLFKYGEDDTYEGDFHDNKRHGKGTRRWPNGEFHVGDWERGAKHGKGILKYPDGSLLYEGDWEFGRKEGKGKMKYPNGDVYEGQFIYGNRNGKGILTSANGDVYDGLWNEDKKHGAGVLDCSDGRSFRGEWVRDAMNGQFVYKFSNGSIYQGEIRQGKMHGKGVMKYANSLTGYHIYEGEFVDDKRNGFGTMTYAKGDVYRGEWKDDNFVSHGRCPSISQSNSRRSSLATIGQMLSQKLIDVENSDGGRSPCISRRSSRNNLSSIGQIISQKFIDADQSDGSRSPCISRRSSRNMSSIGQIVSQKLMDADQSDGSRSPCISRRSSRNTLDSALYDSVDLTLSRRNSITHSQCSTPSRDYDHDMESHHDKQYPQAHTHSPSKDILTADSTAEMAAMNRSNMKGLLDSLDIKLSHCHTTAAAMKNEQLAFMTRMKKKEKDYDFADEKEMYQLEHDVDELEDQKQALAYSRRTSVSNADAIRALFEN